MEFDELVMEALKLSAMGFGMVFALLSVFYLLIQGLKILFPAGKDD